MSKLITFNKQWVQHVAELSICAASVVMSGYVIVNLSGGRLDEISCPSNLYFSIWGSFYISIWILSILLETLNKNQRDVE